MGLATQGMLGPPRGDDGLVNPEVGEQQISVLFSGHSGLIAPASGSYTLSVDGSSRVCKRNSRLSVSLCHRHGNRDQLPPGYKAPLHWLPVCVILCAALDCMREGREGDTTGEGQTQHLDGWPTDPTMMPKGASQSQGCLVWKRSDPASAGTPRDHVSAASALFPWPWFVFILNFKNTFQYSIL